MHVVCDQCLEALSLANVNQLIGEENMFLRVHDAVQYCQKMLMQGTKELPSTV